MRSLAEAIIAGLGLATLAEMAWRRLGLSGPGPAAYLPHRWMRQRRAALRVQVADLAAGAGERLGLTLAECERVRLAGLLHGIGELGLPANLRAKAEPMDPEELEIVAGHPAMGADLVAPIAGTDVAAAVRHHPERCHGSGYPMDQPEPGAPVPRPELLRQGADPALRLGPQPQHGDLHRGQRAHH